MNNTTVLGAIVAAILGFAAYIVFSSSEVVVPPADTATVPDTSSSWKTENSLKAKCDQVGLSEIEKSLLNCTK